MISCVNNLFLELAGWGSGGEHSYLVVGLLLFLDLQKAFCQVFCFRSNERRSSGFCQAFLNPLQDPTNHENFNIKIMENC